MSDWRRRTVLVKLREGCTLGEAAACVGVHRQSVLRWRWESVEFAAAIREARQAGEKERTYRLWLRHPARGKRPPAGRGSGKPRFSYGRR